ncbi:MAG: response regulator [Chroococcidiopsidaceae cyanobacterium CP_BM_ER_R8_30]|nr:response regulator [Chroococcidiopsidaceae cyanobacterium CP_BM_ER_R8_30]
MAEHPAKILLVEDNPEEARLVQETLIEANSVQFKLVPVDRLDQTLKLLGEESFDLILLDLTLPDSQGLETFVATHTQAPDIPIILLTSLNDESLALKAMQSGAQDYLIKGQVFGVGDLLARSVRYAIERQRVEMERQQQTKRERLMA